MAMRIESGLDAVVHDASSVVTVGTFDGVHRGHQAIIRHLNECASLRGGISTLVTFDPHPGDVVRGITTPLLSTISEKTALLESLGLGRMVVIEFTPEFAALSAEEFVMSVLVDRIGLQQIIAGYDHGFGRGRKGDLSLLHRLGAKCGFEVEVIEAQAFASKVVSSRMVRDLLVKEGNVAGAAELLGRSYRLTGTVIEGDRRGQLLGYPTANLNIGNANKLIPRDGVYAVRVRKPDQMPGGDDEYRCASNPHPGQSQTD